MTVWSRMAAAGIISALMAGSPAQAAEIVVISTTPMREVLQDLAPQFEKATGDKVTLTIQSGADISAQIEKGAAVDLVMSYSDAIDQWIKDGKLAAGSRVNFVQSGVGVAVRAGAPKPDISTAAAFKKALLAAKSVGISRGPSGIYFMSLLQKMGIADQIKGKAVFAELGQRVGPLVVSGKVEIGVQQITELLATPGIHYVGPLPTELQTKFGYATGRLRTGKNPQAAAAFVKFISSDAALPALKKLGLERW